MCCPRRRRLPRRRRSPCAALPSLPASLRHISFHHRRLRLHHRLRLILALGFAEVDKVDTSMRVLIDTKIKVDGTEHPIKVYSVRPRREQRRRCSRR